MEKIALNKSSLQKVREQMKLYQRLLPSLDLKRRQLMAELSRAQALLSESAGAFSGCVDEVGRKLPMLAQADWSAKGLVRVKEVKIRQDNVVGVKVPAVESVVCEVTPYSMLVRRHWIDALIRKLEQAVRLKAEAEQAGVRVARLEQGLRRITQRVNLFEKVLIPESKQMISRIQIFLGDAERSAVVRSKISKEKQARN